MLKQVLLRDLALRPLSRDHGVLLVLAQKLTKVAGSMPSKCSCIYDEIREDLIPAALAYISDEETTLGTIDIQENVKDHARKSHQQISRALLRVYDQMPCDGSYEGLHKDFLALSQMIDAHIRWDEHVLFPYIQEKIDAPTCLALEKSTEALESHRKRPTQRQHSSSGKDPTMRRFFCQTCERTFASAEARPACAGCGADYPGGVVTIYLEPEPERDQMYTRADFVAGD